MTILIDTDANGLITMTPQRLRHLIEDAVQAEREACDALCDRERQRHHDSGDIFGASAIGRCQAFIRARKAL